MKFSLNFIRAFNQYHKTAGDVAAGGADKLVEKIGAQLGAVDEVIEIGSKYQDALIVKVLACEKHPDADKLSVCMIDAGSGDNVQVVCGAPNVHKGMLAVWLPPGSTVPSTADKEPFVLEARELRGVVSNGMLASPKELGLGDDHDGILEIEGDYLKPGTDFAQALDFKGDVVIDIENKMFTHRPDCFGFLGIARELAGIQQMPFKSPDWYVTDPEVPTLEAEALPMEVKNELPELVARFCAIAMSDVQVGPSPLWLQAQLAKVGQKSINNIVDYTNWFMLLTGQPLHAYDYDKVKALSRGEAKIVVRKPRKDESVKLLNGKEIQPRPDAIMIATDKQLIGVGGVMGGSETEVDKSTTNIILECASFDMYSIRRTSMEHGLFTDAATRFTKGQSPLQNRTAIARIVDDIRRHAGGKVASPLIDLHGKLAANPTVRLSTDFINQRLGLKLLSADIKKLLENVEFEVQSKGEELAVMAPFWRTDIELPEDVVEEVGRLYGYDHLSLELPRRDLTPTVKDKLLTLKDQIRQTLSRAGANEVLTYSFVHSSLLEKVGQDPAKAFQVANALSPDLQYYRLSLMPSLLEKVHSNIKAGYDQFALFELGKTHGLDHMKDDLPQEFEFTALVVTADDKFKKSQPAYYAAKQYLQELTGARLEFKPVSKDMQTYPVVQPYDMNRAALVSLKGGDFLGIVGEFKPSVSRALKLPKHTAGFEIDTTVLQGLLCKTKYAPLPRFPKVTQDMTLKVAADLAYQQLFDQVETAVNQAKPKAALVTLRPIDIYQPENAGHKNITLRLSIASYERTLTDAEVNKLLDEVAAAAHEQLKAERV